MAMARICDGCKELLTDNEYKQLKVLNALKLAEPRDFKTVKSMDFHNKCYEAKFGEEVA